MAELIFVYWRDIPAQLIVRNGRTAIRRELPQAFIEAIDRCAMRVGARDGDSYLAQWRRGSPQPVSDNLEAEAEKALEAIEKEYFREKLNALVRDGGYAKGLGEEHG